MKLIRNLFALIGLIVVAGIIFVYARLDKNALPEYGKMFGVVLSTGDPAKGMVRRVKMEIPEGMSKQEAFENAIEAMDEVAAEHGLAVVDAKTMPRDGKLFKDGGLLTHIRSYCSPSIADKFLHFSPHFVGFMPCRIGIVEEPNGDIYIYTMSLELMINGGKPLPEDLLVLANEVRTAMYGMLEAGAHPDE